MPILRHQPGLLAPRDSRRHLLLPRLRTRRSMQLQIPQGHAVNTADIAHLIHQHRELLSDRQKFVVHMTSTGWSSRRVASQLGVSHTTVLADLDRAILIIQKAEAA